MATDTSGTNSVTNTLSGTTADEITLQGHFTYVEVENHDAAEELWARWDGTAPVADANECTRVKPGGSKVVGPASFGPNTRAGEVPISVVGDGNQYTITGVE